VAAREEPRNADVQNLLGYTYRKRSSPDLPKAFEHYEAALRLQPTHRGAHEYSGEAYLMDNKPAEGEKHLAQLDQICGGTGCGDYKLPRGSERQVIMVRDRAAPRGRGTDPGIRVVENRCAHRGVRFCQQPHGNARSFVCPYRQWTYKLNGELAGLPFKDGVKD